MSAAFQFEHRAEFLAENADEILRSVPAAPGVFSLRGADDSAEPYLTRAADLRRRLRRLLAPPEARNDDGAPILSKRLNLRDKVRWIEWTRTGSEFESALVLYCATRAAYGAEQARKRLRLYPPYFLRATMAHEHPRVYATNRLSKKSLAEFFGPFPSRAAAERYGDAVLDLFKLRRCHEDLAPFPDHPGCAYGEMKMCMAPCKQICTPAEYAAEAGRVHAFFATRGGSLLNEIAQQREAASEAMDFEAAATLHAQWEKVRAASLLADEIVRPVSDLRAVVVQAAAPREAHEDGETEAPVKSAAPLDEAAVFLLEHGRITGPERLSTLGVRAVREQTAVGSSLFAQPLMLAAVPLEPASLEEAAPEAAVSTLSPEDRARTALQTLTQHSSNTAEPDIAERCDYLSLFRRWYYRPEKQRAGEVFLPNPDAAGPENAWPIRRILNGAARIVLGPPAQMDAINRDAAREALKNVKTKVIHPGREGVERVVPVLPKRGRARKAVTPAELVE